MKIETGRNGNTLNLVAAIHMKQHFKETVPSPFDI